MIRDLTAAVRPSLRHTLRKTPTTYTSYDPTRDHSASSAVVDCAVYRDGRRIDDRECLTPRGAMSQVRESGGFAWIESEAYEQGARAFQDTAPCQLPTPNFQLPRRVVRTSRVEVVLFRHVGATFTPPARTARLGSWSLGVGS